MRILRISFTTTEADAGGVLADLAGRVSALDFNVVERIPYHKNRPLLLNGPSKKKGGSSIPGLFRTSTLAKQDRVTVEQLKGMLQDAGMSPRSYSHAIILLVKEKCIQRTMMRGVYAVIN